MRNRRFLQESLVPRVNFFHFPAGQGPQGLRGIPRALRVPNNRPMTPILVGDDGSERRLTTANDSNRKRRRADRDGAQARSPAPRTASVVRAFNLRHTEVEH